MSNLTIILTFQKLPGSSGCPCFDSSLARRVGFSLPKSASSHIRSRMLAHLGRVLGLFPLSFVFLCPTFAYSRPLCLMLALLGIIFALLGAMLAPLWPPRPTKYVVFPRENAQLRKVTFFTFSLQRSPKWSQKAPKDNPKATQGRPKEPQSLPKGANRAPKAT